MVVVDVVVSPGGDIAVTFPPVDGALHGAEGSTHKQGKKMIRP